MATVTRRALRVYAALSEFRGPNEDILDALIPFFEPILEVMNGKFFDPRLFSVAIQKLYRWRFNRDIAEALAPRLAAKGHLKRTGNKHGEAIYHVTYTAPLGDTNELEIDRVLKRVIDEFETFPPRVTDLLNYNRTRAELTDILIGFLVSLDAYREQRLSFEVQNINSLPDAESVLSQLEEGGTPLGQDDRYMAARFVRHLCTTKPDYVSHLARLASIGLLTEVVQDFVKPTQSTSNARLTIALDAPLALDYLGCSGRDLQADIKGVIEPLIKIGCSVVVFSTSAEEMKRNLDSMLGKPEHLRYGYTWDAVIKGEVLLDYVRAVAHDPMSKLEAAGVTVKSITRFQFPNSHVHFDSALYEDFFSYVDWVEEVEPREHDAECTALVMRLREGKQSADLFRSGFVFVTRNGAFVRKSRT